MDPILNVIADHIKGFVEKYIAHVPADQQEAFKAHAEELAVKVIEAGAKGAVEGAKGA